MSMRIVLEKKNPAARVAKARWRTTRKIDATSAERSRIRHIGQSRVQRLHRRKLLGMSFDRNSLVFAAHGQT